MRPSTTAKRAVGPSTARLRRRRLRGRVFPWRAATAARPVRTDIACVVTCEHGGNRVPPEQVHRFVGLGDELAGHQGWDLGALEIAGDLAHALEAEMVAATVTRLLVDLNRSSGHPRLFSEATRGLPPQEREEILRRYYHPHRNRVRDIVAGNLSSGRLVLHIAAHSFTPVLSGVERMADVGLLYDPAREAEARFCRLWQEALHEHDTALRVRRNYPYKGVSDGLATSLRKEFGLRYMGVELEVNQRFVAMDGTTGSENWKRLCGTLARSARMALERLAQG